MWIFSSLNTAWNDDGSGDTATIDPVKRARAGLPPVTPADVGQPVDSTAGMTLRPGAGSSSASASGSATTSGGSGVDLDKLFGGSSLFGSSPKTSTSTSPTATDLTKLIDQATKSGLEIYGASKGQQPKGSGATLQRVAPSNNTWLVAAGVVTLGLLGVGLALSRKSSVPAKAAEAPKLVANKLKRNPGTVAWVALAALGVYGWLRTKKDQASWLADHEDSVDWLNFDDELGGGYSMNLVGGGEW